MWTIRALTDASTGPRTERDGSKHGQDEGFAIYAERMMTVNTCDFLNPMRTAGSVRLAPHLQGTANTFAMAE